MAIFGGDKNIISLVSSGLNWELDTFDGFCLKIVDLKMDRIG